MHKKLLVVISLFALLISCTACTGRATQVIQTPNGPEIRIYGDGVDATFENGVLKLNKAENSFISDISVDGERVWAVNDSCKIGNYTPETEIRVTAETLSEKPEQEITSLLLSFYDSAQNAYSLTWHSEKQDAFQVVFTENPTGAQYTVDAFSDEASEDYVNRAVIYDLKAGTEYSYTIFNSADQAKYSAAFTTADASPESVTFLHVSDTQDEEYNGAVWEKLMADAQTHTDKIDLIMHTGDMVQYGNQEALWTQMLSHVRSYVSTIPIMLVSGNHSYWSDYTDGTDDIEYNHTTVKLPKQDTENGQYYSFDYGDIHFVVLSSGDSSKKGVGKEQLAWLENDLASTEKSWIIVSIHNPLYSPGKYGSSEDRNGVALALRESLAPVLNQYDVDLVLQGHDHVFALTYPMDANSTPLQTKTVTENGCTYFEAPTAPVYLMSGAAGNQNRGVVDEYNPAFFAKTKALDDNTAGYSVITVTKEKLTATYYEYDYANNKPVSEYSWGIIKDAA